MHSQLYNQVRRGHAHHVVAVCWHLTLKIAESFRNRLDTWRRRVHRRNELITLSDRTLAISGGPGPRRKQKLASRFGGHDRGDATTFIAEREISYENSTKGCRSSAVVGLGNRTKRQRSGASGMDETDSS